MSAPLRKSLFERQKAEAQAKRQREKEETAAVYEDFVKSFEDDGRSASVRNAFGGGDGGRYGSRLGGSDAQHAPSMPAAPVPGPSKRHFTSKGMGRPSGGFPMLGAKKSANERGHRDSSLKGMFSFEKPSSGDYEEPPAKKVFAAPDIDEDEAIEREREAEKAAAKPTLRLSSLPPGTSPAAVKALIPPHITVDNVKIIPPSSQGNAPTAPGGDQRLWSAIVTVAHDTAATELDAVVSLLQNRYLGWGHYLSISRHLSSAALNSITPLTTGLASLNAANPFGARQVQSKAGPGGRFGPPGRQSRGFAPPSSYEPGSAAKYRSNLEVVVSTPSDLKQLKLIHKTIENLLIHGHEFEALLMSRPEVQKDEKWAWIWDSKSTGGVYYRWKLWDILTGSATSRRRTRHHHHVRPTSTSIFTTGPVWLAPTNLPRFEYITQLDEFVSDEDYDSSEDEDSDREEDRRQKDEGAGTPGGIDGAGVLNPLQKAKLTHLLVHLPTTHAKLRKGDIAGVTSFAISHASRGAEEVVDLVVANISRPFVYSGDNPEYKRDDDAAAQAKKNEEVGNENEGQEQDSMGTRRIDDSAAKLVGLYVVSDILSTSSTSGVRHAWRYRQLFESAFKAYKTFEGLGKLEKELGWGRLKTEKWRRSITNILSLWEGWCVFSQASHEHFVQVFEKPPLTAEEEAKAAEEKAKAEASIVEKKSKSRWKTVEEDSTAQAQASSILGADAMDIDPEAATATNDDIDGEPMTDGYDSIDGWPMEDSSDEEDLDGKPMDLDDEMGDEGNAAAETNLTGIAAKDAISTEKTDQLAEASTTTSSAMNPIHEPATSEPPVAAASSTTPAFKVGTGRPRPRPRPKASDMFADSDGE
ncbi:RNA polymerase II, large subunit, CTD [Ascosphaera apis ARSEF 7405]|uniref:RNA polymerase II, large subunit, CTD n=1 Tax=Ascosphaera apis ARSEF 7405 TaxID=392613 RepID=A0A168BSX0_9EURO|nr:RNA polymerase II, large subunit, CTD [Ascosphaera apis ARSEF 7405]